MSKPLGRRIMEYRESRGVGRDELGERIGLDGVFIKAVEEDDLHPSLGPLIKISRSLGVRLGTFLDDRVSEDPLVVRADERKEQPVTHRGADRPAEAVFHSLGRGKTDRRMEPFFVELMPESGAEKKLSSHEGEEFIAVQSGTVELTYGREVFELKPGDTVYYNSSAPHHVAAGNGQKAEILAVLYIPE